MQLRVLVSIAFAITGVYAQAQLAIDTPPSVVQCQPTQLNFRGGSPPYIISIIPGGQVGAAALKTFPTESGNSLTWIVDILAGTSITLQIKDQSGNVAFSAIITIQANSDSSCIGNGGSSSGSSTSAGSSSTTGSTSSGGGSTTSASSTAPSTTAASTPSTPAATSTTASTTSPATSPSSSSRASTTSSTSSTAAARSGTNGASAFNSGPAAGIIGILLAAIVA